MLAQPPVTLELLGAFTFPANGAKYLPSVPLVNTSPSNSPPLLYSSLCCLITSFLALSNASLSFEASSNASLVASFSSSNFCCSFELALLIPSYEALVQHDAKSISILTSVVKIKFNMLGIKNTINAAINLFTF